MMKNKSIIIVGILCLVCLAAAVPAVSAANSLPTFNRSAATPGSVFYSGISIATEPVDTTFSKPVAISFTLSPDQWTQALDVTNGNTANIVIGAFDDNNQTWSKEYPTTLTTNEDGTHTVNTSTLHTGVFAVFYIVEPLGATPSPTTQTFGNMVGTGSTPAAPVNTPAAAATPAATAAGKPQSAPTQSPMLPGIVVVGVIGAVAILVARKNL